MTPLPELFPTILLLFLHDVQSIAKIIADIQRRIFSASLKFINCQNQAELRSKSESLSPCHSKTLYFFGIPLMSHSQSYEILRNCLREEGHTHTHS